MTHVEWLEAGRARLEIAEPGEEMPDGQSVDQGHVGLILMSDDVIVIKGTPDEVMELLKSAARRLRKGR